MTFCTAIPLLLPFAALFMLLSYKIDRYNLLRVFKPPPRTTDRTITLAVLYILPISVFSHVWMAQSGLDLGVEHGVIMRGQPNSAEDFSSASSCSSSATDCEGTNSSTSGGERAVSSRSER